jgi:hypothetical protein
MQNTIHIEQLFNGRAYAFELGKNLSPNFLTELSDSLLQIFDKMPAASVTVLIDMSAVRTFPLNINLLMTVSAWLRHPKLDGIIVCGTKDPAIHFIARVITQSVGVHLQIFPQRSEAMQFLQTAYTKT